MLQLEADLAASLRKSDDKDKAAAEERSRLLELVESGNKRLEDLRTDKDKQIEDIRGDRERLEKDRERLEKDRERVEKRDKEIIDELRKPFIKRLFGG